MSRSREEVHLSEELQTDHRRFWSNEVLRNFNVVAVAPIHNLVGTACWDDYYLALHWSITLVSAKSDILCKMTAKICPKNPYTGPDPDFAAERAAQQNQHLHKAPTLTFYAQQAVHLVTLVRNTR